MGGLTIWSFTTNNLVLSRYILCTVWIGLIYWLYSYLGKTNKSIRDFILNIKEGDFVYIPEFGKDLNHLIGSLNTELKTISLEKVKQSQLFTMAVNQSTSGIIIFNEDGHILLKNNAIEDIFFIKTLSNIQELSEANPELFKKLISSKENSFIISIKANKQLLKIAVHQNQFKQKGKKLTVASFQNISTELDKEELESWKKLMHVITHEIMNSVTPMKTLTYSLFEMFKKDQGTVSLNDLSEQDINDTFMGLQAMNNRVQGLMHFVNSYRKLYKIPEPQFAHFEVHEIIDEINILFKESFLEKNIEFEIKGDSRCSLFADKSLMTQVLINLVRNSIDAVQNQKNPVIEIKITNGKNDTIISVTDNGVGIKNEDLKDIFIPFFTTKEKGTGIGLYYSKMIVYMHKGNIKVLSEINKGTCFSIHL